jgi:hypothetical protein
LNRCKDAFCFAAEIQDGQLVDEHVFISRTTFLTHFSDDFGRRHFND